MSIMGIKAEEIKSERQETQCSLYFCTRMRENTCCENCFVKACEDKCLNCKTNCSMGTTETKSGSYKLQLVGRGK